MEHALIVLHLAHEAQNWAQPINSSMAISQPSMTLQWCKQIALIMKTQPWEMTKEQPPVWKLGCQDNTLQPRPLNSQTI